MVLSVKGDSDMITHVSKFDFFVLFFKLSSLWLYLHKVPRENLSLLSWIFKRKKINLVYLCLVIDSTKLLNVLFDLVCSLFCFDHSIKVNWLSGLSFIILLSNLLISLSLKQYKFNRLCIFLHFLYIILWRPPENG